MFFNIINIIMVNIPHSSISSAPYSTSPVVWTNLSTYNQELNLLETPFFSGQQDYGIIYLMWCLQFRKFCWIIKLYKCDQIWQNHASTHIQFTDFDDL